MHHLVEQWCPNQIFLLYIWGQALATKFLRRCKRQHYVIKAWCDFNRLNNVTVTRGSALMIQIIALRPFIDNTGKEKKKHELLGFTPSVRELFKTIDTVVSKIPEEQRWNVYYTALTCLDPAKHNGALRRFKEQSVIPFDLDGIDTEKLEAYIKIFCEVIGADPQKIGTVFSGNGLQFVIELDKPFTDVNYFEQKRLQYKTICDKINTALEKESLPGGADASVWSPARILRLPNTINRKPKKGDKQALMLQSTIEPVAFDWDKISGVPELTVADHLAEWNDKKAPKLDNKAIFSGCDFLKWIQVHPDQIREPAFYSALSIVGRMENGRALAHNIQESIRNTGSDSSVASMAASQVDDKLDQALANSGPRTCTNINTTPGWGKCAKCPNFNKITSPVQLKSPDFIATKETGFYRVSKKGGMIPCFEDLIKHFDQTYHFKTLNQNGLVYAWNGTHYTDFTATMIKNFAVESFKPLPKQSFVNEFFNLVSEKNIVSADFFMNNDGFINFKNGVLNIEKGTLSPHDPSRGFRYVLPYDYDPTAVATRFDKFLDEITCGDKALRANLEEFGGWALSGDDYWLHKCLLLVGEGKNGKSKFINALRFVAGLDNIAALSLDALVTSQNNRQLLEGKLFNIASEMSHRDMRDTDMFKRLTEGGVIDVKKMYYQPYLMENRTKFIFACNTLPHSTDQSYGFLRRMLIVPFNATFEGALDDPHLDAKFKAELPGIFNVFLAGYKRLKSQGEFTHSAASVEALAEYAEDSNPITQFLYENKDVVVNPLNGKCTLVTLDDLYESFVAWNTVGEAKDKKAGRYEMRAFSLMVRRAMPEGQARIEKVSFDKGKVFKRAVWDIELKSQGGDKTYTKKPGKPPELRGSETVEI